MDKELPVSAWPEWKIIEKIGEGSFGKVYKAQRTERGKSFYSAEIIELTHPSSNGDFKFAYDTSPRNDFVPPTSHKRT